MTTALQLCARAYRMTQKTAMLPTATESASILEYLNGMLDSWNTERLIVYAMQELTLTMVDGKSSYTVGSGGDLDTTRLVKIEKAFMRDNDDDSPVEIYEYSQWADISDKSVTGDIVEIVYYQPTMASGVLNVWPVPSAANVLHLVAWTPLSALALGDDITLPPGYEDALVYNLAVRIEPEFGPGQGLNPTILGLARATKSSIKNANSTPIMQKGGARQFSSYNHFNIERF